MPETNITKTPTIKIGSWFVYSEHSMLQSESGEVVELECMAMELLNYMAHHRGSVISIEELMDNVWTGKIVTHSTVRRIISLVRKALKDDVKSPSYIQNIPKKGYILIADVDISGRNSPTNADINSYFITHKEDNSIKAIPQMAFLVSKKHFFLWPMLLLTAVFLFYFIVNYVQQSPKDLKTLPIVSVKGAEKDLHYAKSIEKVIFSHKEIGGEYWHLFSIDTQSNLISRLSTGNHNDTKPQFSPDADRVAFLRQDGPDFHIMLGTYTNENKLTNLKKVHSTNLPISNIIWNEYGDGLFFSALDERFIYSVFTLNLIDNSVTRLTLPASNSGGDYLVTLSNDNKHLAVARLAGNETEIIVYRLEGFSPTFFSKVNAIVKSLTWHNGDLLYLMGNTIYSIVPGDNWNTRTYHESTTLISQLQSTDGRLFAVQGDLSNNEIRQLNNPFTVDSLSESSFTISSPQRDFAGIYSKVSDRIYFLSHRSGLRQIWQWDHTNGFSQLTEFPTYQQVDNLHSAYHGEFLTGTIGRQLFILEVASRTLTYLSPENHYVSAPAWSIDGEYIYYVNHYLGEHELWKVHVNSKQVERVDKNISAIQPYPGNNQFIAHDNKSTFFYNINNGNRTSISDDIQLQLNVSWQVVNDYLYWTKSIAGGSEMYRINLSNLELEQTANLVTGLNHRFSIKSDGSKVLFNISSSPQTDIIEFK